MGKPDFSEYIDLLGPYPFTMVMETRDEDDKEGCVLRSRDRLNELLRTATR